MHNKGAFMVALFDLNCSEYFMDFINILCSGNYQDRLYSKSCININAPHINITTREISIKVLTGYLKRNINKEYVPEDVDKINFINEVIELLSD